MLIIGLDPGLGTTGWGIVAKSGSRLSHVANGQIGTDPKAPLAERLVVLDRELADIILAHRPDSGAVSHGFERLGLIEYAITAGDEDTVLEAAIEAGADDVESDEGGHQIWVAIDALHPVARELEKTLGEAQAVKLAWKPSLTTEVDVDAAVTLLKLIDLLDEDDDVQAVWGNYEISDAVMEKLGDQPASQWGRG